MDYAQRLQERVAARRMKLTEVAENLKKTEDDRKNAPLRERNQPPSTSTLKIKTQVEVTLDKHCTGMTVTVPKVQVVRGAIMEEKENSGRGQASEVLINYKMLHERVEKLTKIPHVEDGRITDMKESEGTEHEKNSKIEEGVSKERETDLQHQQHDDSDDDSDGDTENTEDENGGDDLNKDSSEEKTEADETEPVQKQTASLATQSFAGGDNLMRDTVKDHLHRLGKLYGDANLSSPIHRTENNFNAVDEAMASRRIKTPGRSTRLAALASSINSWEDDLRHSQITKSKEGVTPKQGKTLSYGSERSDKANNRHVTWGANVGGAQNRGVIFKRIGSFENTNTSGSVSGEQKADVSKSSNLPKKVAFDHATLETLEAQGYSRTVSRSRLVYDYSIHASQEEENKASPPPKQDGKDKMFSPVCSPTVGATSPSLCQSPRMGLAAFRSAVQHGPGSPSKFNASPEKQPFKSSVVDTGVGVAVSRSSPEKMFATGSPKMGISSVYKLASSPDKRVGLSSSRSGAVGSPRNAEISPGSVLSKAAVFESHSPAKKAVKDPAELPISERLALFERNKGQPPLPKPVIPLPAPKKCQAKRQLPLTDLSVKVLNAEQKQIKPGMSLPAVVPPNVEGGAISSAPSSRILEQLQKFESGVVSESEAVRMAKEERLKELQALHNRWNRTNESSMNMPSKSSSEEKSEVQTSEEKSEMQKGIERWHSNKTTASSSNKKDVVQDYPPVPSAPPLPSTPHVPLQPSLPEETEQVKKIVPSDNRHAKGVSPDRQYRDIKKIKMSPPKPGRLYPCLSDIEATTTETETDAADDEYQSLSSDEMSDTDHEMSFGREIIEAAGLKHPRRTLKQDLSDGSNLSEEESAVCDDMDEFLDEALANDSDSDGSAPTPPKKHRGSTSPENRWKTHHSPSSSKSHSFEYVRGENVSQSPSVPTSAGTPRVTLTHTISVYRRQQNMKNTPVRQVTRKPDCDQYSQAEHHGSTTEVEANINQKISDLLDEVTKQQIVISQASQALNLCSNTIEFMGSAEQVEGERLLLLATHKRQALLNEIQRIKIEGTLKAKCGSQSNEELFDKGNLTVSHITLPLKRDYLRQMAADNTCHHYMCLLRCQEQVLATPVLATSPENLLTGSSALLFPGHLRMEGLYGDFKAKLEVYTMQTPKEILPHDVKYHIHKDKKDCGKLRLTPKKLHKQDSKLVMLGVQSPGGPSAVRTSNFQLTGFVVFSLREIKRTHFTLNKVAFSSPLEGSVQMRLCSELTLDVTERGFLNLYQDVSGLGSLLRRWFVLKGSRLSYWRYPEEEKCVEPLGYIDLNICITDPVGLVPRSTCTRPNTFLLEIRRSTRPDDRDSLVMTVEPSHTVVRYFLTADTKEERLEWCYQLNKALAMLRAWGALSLQ